MDAIFHRAAPISIYITFTALVQFYGFLTSALRQGHESLTAGYVRTVTHGCIHGRVCKGTGIAIHQFYCVNPVTCPDMRTFSLFQIW